jgi:hypothetical protein
MTITQPNNVLNHSIQLIIFQNTENNQTYRIPLHIVFVYIQAGNSAEKGQCFKSILLMISCRRYQQNSKLEFEILLHSVQTVGNQQDAKLAYEIRYSTHILLFSDADNYY